MRWSCPTVANSFPILHRLAGLETEYALRIPSQASTQRSHFEVYESLIQALSQQVPTAEAALDKTGLFLANGGAIWFEMALMVGEFGLIEGSTPECRGARQLLLYQRAQDALFCQAAADAPGGPFYLVKNCRDSVGNIYGAQENYEFPLADGWRLLAWRLGLIALTPLIPLTWLGQLILKTVSVMAVQVCLVLGFLLCLLVHGIGKLAGSQRSLRERMLAALTATRTSFVPALAERVLNYVVLLICLPLAGGMYLLLRLTAFWQVRRQLSAFLITRGIITGAGTLDDGGHFHISEKATGLNCMFSLSGLVGDRPLFAVSHFLKAAINETWNTKRRYFRLFRRKQRLQIALGDSNMAQTAEYLRMGITMLLLDMVESGALRNAPRIAKPIQALKKIGADPSLTTLVELTTAGHVTALEIQRFYLQAAKDWVAGLPQPGEARQVLNGWEDVLDQLEHDRPALIGQVDWITKLHLIVQAGPAATLASKKKIDLKYHELGPEGYFSQLAEAGLCLTQVSDQEVHQAQRTPPTNSPASARGRFIREFAGEGLSVNWDFVLLDRRFRKQVIHLDHYFESQPQREEAASP